MKKLSLMIAGACVLLAACDKKPEKVIEDIYASANEHKYEELIPYLLPDSITPFTDEEKKNFVSLLETRALPEAPMYTVLEIDSLKYNAARDSASFTVHTTFKDGVSYVEKGMIYKNAKGKWLLSLNNDDFSTSDSEKYTPELMRNLRNAVDMVLASRGIPQYQLAAADYYFYGVMETKDLQKYFSLIKAAADKGDVDAIISLGYAYYKGYGIEKDQEKALELYKSAAAKGDALAMYNIGCSYRDGEGTVKDYDEAVKWYQKAMDAGNNDAILNMGLMYENGYGVEKDMAKAVEYYQKSANLGDEYGYYNLANRYWDGTGVEKDLDKAIELFKKVVGMDGDLATESTNQIGAIYYYDKKDYDKAFYYFKKATESKDAKGLYYYNLGQCYEYGRGTDRDRKKANSVYRKAVDLGYEGAQSARWRTL